MKKKKQKIRKSSFIIDGQKFTFVCEDTPIGELDIGNRDTTHLYKMFKKEILKLVRNK